MAIYSNKNILDSRADYLFFASSSMLTPKEIHGDKDTAPLKSMSALASALYDYDNKIATILAVQLKKAAEKFQESRRIPLMFTRLDDGRVIAPFIVRRHISDPIDNRVIALMTSIIYDRIQAEGLGEKVFSYAIERPIDAGKVYDRLLSTMPDNVTIHKEVRYE